jgi:DNA polymerase III subunit epsilon
LDFIEGIALLMNTPNPDLLAVVDVETTGLSPWRNDRIVEIAVLLMSPDGAIHQEYETLVNPDRDLGPSRIHHITAGEVQHAPKFADIAGDVAALLSRANILAGHNIRFDQNFLIAEYQRLGIMMPDIPILCTCDLLGRSSLAVCCQEFGIAFEGEPHHAISDARATASLIRRLIEDDGVLSSFHPSSIKWPEIPQRKMPLVSRDIAQEKLRAPPAFLQRIASKIHHDTDANTPDLLVVLCY